MSTVLLQLFLGQPWLLFPVDSTSLHARWHYWSVFWGVCPNQPHLRLLNWMTIFSCLALAHNSSFLMTSGRWMPLMDLQPLLKNDCLLLEAVFVIPHVSEPYRRTDFHGLMNSINWPALSVWVFKAQLVEHCSANAEVTGLNPVKDPWTFSGLFRNCLNCYSLRWSHIHFIHVSVEYDFIRSLVFLDVTFYLHTGVNIVNAVLASPFLACMYRVDSPSLLMLLPRYVNSSASSIASPFNSILSVFLVLTLIAFVNRCTSHRSCVWGWLIFLGCHNDVPASITLPCQQYQSKGLLMVHKGRVDWRLLYDDPKRGYAIGTQLFISEFSLLIPQPFF